MSLTILYDEKYLLMQIAEGDERAFRQLYERHTDTIYGVAFAYTKSAEFSEEIVQDVFIKIWVKRHTVAAVENFSNYLFIIARNLIITQLRKKIREKKYLHHLSHYFKENTITPEQELLFKESNALIENAIARLPKQQQLVYKLCHQQGFKLDEIAAQMGLSRDTVKKHLGKGIQFIKASLRKHSSGLLLLLSLL